MVEAYTIILLISAFLVFAYLNLKKKYNYWRSKNVPCPKTLFLFGNYAEYILLRKPSESIAQDICKQFPETPFIGTFFGTEPALIVKEPEMIKLVLTKDFYYFSGREISDYLHNEVVTQNIFFTYGDRWRVIRQNLTPIFTSTKMKNMFHLIDKCSYDLERMLDRETKSNDVFDVRSFMVKYTMDCISSCAFGINANLMKESAPQNGNIFEVIGNQVFDSSTYRAIKKIGRTMWPSIFYKLGFKYYPDTISQFFDKLLIEVFEKRQYKPSSRNDFVDLVMNFKQNEFLFGDSVFNSKTGEMKKVRLAVDDVLMAGQCTAIFTAGFETSATTLHFTLYELAKNPEIQERVLGEVDAYLKKNGNKLHYECVNELPYLYACFQETMRLYPILGILTREAMEDYRFPSGLRIDKGTRIHIPIKYLHHNPEYFPEPEVYRPERFYLDAKKDVKPFTYLPFGEGPRICIGARFAKMQMNAGLVTFLKKYKVELAEGTPTKLEFNPKSFLTQTISNTRLKLVIRDGWEQRQYQRSG